MSGPAHDEELAALLGRLRPAPEGISIARLLFRAGQVLATRRSWVWPCATAASMLLAVTLGTVLLLRPEPQPIERIVEVQVRSPTAPAPELIVADQTPTPAVASDFATNAGWPQSGDDYFQLRQQVLSKGVEALPPPTPWPSVVQPDELDILLDVPRGAGKAGSLRPKQPSHSGSAL